MEWGVRGTNDNTMRCSNWMLTYGYTRIIWSWERLKCLRRPQVCATLSLSVTPRRFWWVCIQIGPLWNISVAEDVQQ